MIDWSHESFMSKVIDTPKQVIHARNYLIYNASSGLYSAIYRRELYKLQFCIDLLNQVQLAHSTWTICMAASQTISRVTLTSTCCNQATHNPDVQPIENKFWRVRNFWLHYLMLETLSYRNIWTLKFIWHSYIPAWASVSVYSWAKAKDKAWGWRIPSLA